MGLWPRVGGPEDADQTPIPPSYIPEPERGHLRAAYTAEIKRLNLCMVARSKLL